MIITMTPTIWDALHRFMDAPVERVAFFFAEQTNANQLTIVATQLLSDDTNYALATNNALELADTVRPEIIQYAHQTNLIVIEAHSHYWSGQYTRFSAYDLQGLTEFAPHMLWRLPGRPYISLVIGKDSFDSLVWLDRTTVQVLDALQVGDTMLVPTGLSLAAYQQLQELLDEQ